MKTIITFLLVAGITISTQAKDKDFISFYRTYKHQSGMINFTLPAFILNIATIGQDEEVKDVLKSTSRIRLMVKEENSEYLYQAIDNYLNKDKYKNLLHVRDGSTYVKIAAQIKDDQIKEIILVVNDEETFVAIQLKGNYTFEQIRELANQI